MSQMFPPREPPPLKIYCCYFVCVADARYLGDGGTNRRENMCDGIYRSRTDLLLLGGGTPGVP